MKKGKKERREEMKKGKEERVMGGKGWCQLLQESIESECDVTENEESEGMRKQINLHF